MSLDRRFFLKLAGVIAAGTAGSAALPAIEPNRQRGPEPAPSRAMNGRRWAMAVDLTVCRQHPGCHACIDACNTIHNIPQIPDPRHEIKWIWEEPFDDAFPTRKTRFMTPELVAGPVLLLCNHCDDPPCVRVCPTQATWKRKDGVVMMDWHRCIGCRYCMAACPYGSRSFNWVDPRPYIKNINPDFPTRERGVVEKCDLCQERLARGKLPACVEACPYGALTFGDIGDENSQIRKLLDERISIRRKPGLGTSPQVYYLV